MHRHHHHHYHHRPLMSLINLCYVSDSGVMSNVYSSIFKPW
jgi:hypothetical protein